MRSRFRSGPKPSDKPATDVVFGLNPVRELLRARPEEVESLWVASNVDASSELLDRAREAGIRVQKVDRDRLNAACGNGVHQGVVAKVREFSYAELEDLLEPNLGAAEGGPPVLMVLDGIQDPQNLGAIVRSTHALGGRGVIIPKDRAAQVTGAAMKAAAGALAHCPVARVVNLARALETIKEAGYWVAAADVRGDTSPAKANLEGPLALVVGSEGAGIREGVLKHCDFRLQIPMVGEVGSLNASVSAGILLYEVLRRRTVERAHH